MRIPAKDIDLCRALASEESPNQVPPTLPLLPFEVPVGEERKELKLFVDHPRSSSCSDNWEVFSGEERKELELFVDRPRSLICSNNLEVFGSEERQELELFVDRQRSLNCCDSLEVLSSEEPTEPQLFVDHRRSLSFSNSLEVPIRSPHLQTSMGHVLPRVEDEQTRTSPSPTDKHQNTLDTAGGKEDCKPSNEKLSALHQLVLYNPDAVNRVQDHSDSHASQSRSFSGLYGSNELFGSFTVQCNTCFKWRLIPTKEKYEKIREKILQEPFVCSVAHGWGRTISCEDPADIFQDDSRLWAIDKPNIAQPPPGWERLIRLRGEGGTRFADVYYVAPTGKKLRSLVEVQKYLAEHPEYIEQGVKQCQFSFQTPRPLRDDYVRKRPRRTISFGDTSLESERPLDPSEVKPRLWSCPDEHEELQANQPGPMTLCPDQSITPPPRAKKAKCISSSSKKTFDDPVFNQMQIKVERGHQAWNASSCEL